MQATDLARFSLNTGDKVFTRLIADLREHPLATQSPSGGNHAMWTLGHIAFVEAALPSIVLGTPHAYEAWAPLFAQGTTPVADGKGYPSFDELMKAYATSRAANLKLVDELGDAKMAEKPKAIPKGFENEMATIGQTFAIIAMHQMMHAGEVADIRRAVGLPRFS
jgi:hypothetical protein